MALSILDGNQSATTLSTIVTSGQHIPAHTVVSLGTQAISNITSAVSGTAVTFGLVGGTVTANNFTLTNVLQYDGSHYFLKVGGVATTGGTSFPVYVAGSVTVGNSVTIGSLPAISGTVTANLGLNELPYIKVDINVSSAPSNIISNVYLRRIGEYTYESIRYQGNEDEAYLKVVLEVLGESAQKAWRLYSEGSFAELQGIIATCLPQNAGSSNGDPFPPKTGWTLGAGITGTLSISYEQPSTQPISGTVTANSSNGELTTRFGSITTANTAFSTTAVTNTSRKYLMIQNIATTVITAGIGFTPTTTQGIQIVAGATITFDGNYIPTGAVRILSSVTASNFTVLEA